MTLTHLWNMGSTCVCCAPFGRGKDPQPACLYKQRVEKGADCPTQAQKGPKLGGTRQNGHGKRMGFTPCISQTSCCLLLSSSFKTQQCIFEEYKPERHQTQEYYVGLNASRTWGPHLLPESRLQKPGLYTQEEIRKCLSKGTVISPRDNMLTSRPHSDKLSVWLFSGKATSTQTSLTHNDPTALFFITSQRGTVKEASKNKSQGNRHKSNVV